MTTQGPDVVGVAGACLILGVSRQRLAVLRTRPDFPVPTLTPAPVWDREAIEAWKAQR